MNFVVSIGAALAIIAGLATSPARAQAPAQAQAIPVGVTTATTQSVSPTLGFTGRIESIQKVEVRARVTGFIEDVLFKDGSLVAAGAPLYKMEQPPFIAAQQQARGALVQAQAAYANASLQRQRADELVKTSAASVATRDDRVAAEQNAQGAVVKADADVKTADINLAYTEISSPIAGRVGRTALTKGNVASPSSGILTTVLSIDPIYVTFPVSQREFLRVQQEKEKVTADSLTVGITFADGSVYPDKGRIDFIDPQVDRSTDTVLVRAVLSNKDGRLLDGEFVTVSVTGDKPEQRLVIPQAAIIIDQAGQYVFVAANNKAEVRRVKLGVEVGPNVTVNEGLKAGDLVVVEGVQNLRPGVAVQPSPVRPAVTGG